MSNTQIRSEFWSSFFPFDIHIRELSGSETNQALSSYMLFGVREKKKKKKRKEGLKMAVDMNFSLTVI